MLSRFRALLVLTATFAVVVPLLTTTAAQAASSKPLPVAGQAQTQLDPPAVLARAKALFPRSMAPMNARALQPDVRASQPSERKTTAVPLGHADVTMALRDLSLVLPRLSTSDQQVARSILARPTDGASDQYGDGYTTHEATPVCGPDVCVHYVTSTTDKATLAQVHLTLATMEHVYTTETGTMGFRKPLSDGTRGGNSKLDVYLANVGAKGYYGYCSTDDVLRPGRTQPAYCVLDNDFSRAEFHTDPVMALDVTAAHEFFHAVQYAYDYTEDLWLMEGTAVWMEDQVYNSINDYVQYAPFSSIAEPRTPVDYAGDFERYGAFLFWKFLSEKTHDTAIVRDVWNAAVGPHFSLQAVRIALAEHHLNFTTMFATYGAWNTLFTHTYREKAFYPRVHWWHDIVLARHRRSTGSRTVTLRHLTNASMRVRPSSNLTRRARLRVVINGPNLGKGSAATLQIRHANLTVTLRRIKLGPAGNAVVTVPVPPKQVRAVVVVVTNASTLMTGCNKDPGQNYACGGRGIDDSDRFTVRARLL